jgi:predicted transcriptional regulator
MPKKYSSKKICELLKLLVKNEVIRIDNLSRWDQLFKGNKVNDDKLLIIEATDRPLTKRVIKYDEKLKMEIEVDEPITKGEDEYTTVNLPMLQYYLDVGLDEKYFALYTIVRKYANSEQGCTVTIENMEELFGIDHNTINRMIWKLNDLYLLASHREKRGKGKYNFHHWVCGNEKEFELFKKDYGEICDTLTKRRKKVEQKKKNEIDNSIKESNAPKEIKETIIDVELAFGNTKTPRYEKKKHQEDEFNYDLFT